MNRNLLRVVIHAEMTRKLLKWLGDVKSYGLHWTCNVSC